eukprot:2116578-Karenia_brevis.AAC.1
MLFSIFNAFIGAICARVAANAAKICVDMLNFGLSSRSASVLWALVLWVAVQTPLTDVQQTALPCA